MTSVSNTFRRPENSIEAVVVYLRHGLPLGVGTPRFWLAVADSSNIGLHKLSPRRLLGAFGLHLGGLTG
jgi:hypothetical protein